MKVAIQFLVIVAVVCYGSCATLPENCIIYGSSLLSTCAKEVAVATKFFDVSADDTEAIANLEIKPSQIDDLLVKIGDPSESCCKGTCQFSNDYCGCNDEMINLINGFVGGNFKFFRAVSEAVAKQCGFNVYYQDNCPKNKWQKKWKKYKLADCTKFD